MDLHSWRVDYKDSERRVASGFRALIFLAAAFFRLRGLVREMIRQDCREQADFRNGVTATG
jgi:hypothetical protein